MVQKTVVHRFAAAHVGCGATILVIIDDVPTDGLDDHVTTT